MVTRFPAPSRANVRTSDLRLYVHVLAGLRICIAGRQPLLVCFSSTSKDLKAKVGRDTKKQNVATVTGPSQGERGKSDVGHGRHILRRNIALRCVAFLQGKKAWPGPHLPPRFLSFPFVSHNFLAVPSLCFSHDRVCSCRFDRV